MTNAAEVANACEPQKADLKQFAKIDHTLGFLKPRCRMKRLARHVVEVCVRCKFRTSLFMRPRLNRLQQSRPNARPSDFGLNKDTL